MNEQKIAEIENKIINGEVLTEEELRCCAWGDVGKYINEIEEGSGRWTQSMSTIFEIEGQLYCIDWQRDLTEYQESEYWGQPYKVRREEKVVTTTVVNYVEMKE